MRNGIEAMITDITATTAEAEDYTGEDGLLYCGKCHTPKEAYFAEGKTCFGRDRHPTDCDCQRAAREKQQAAESRQKHLEKVEDLKRRGFTDPATPGLNIGAYGFYIGGADLPLHQHAIPLVLVNVVMVIIML